MTSLSEDEIKRAMAAVAGVDGNLVSAAHRRRFVECAVHFGLMNKKNVPNKSATLLRLIDETWEAIQARKTKRALNFAASFGLKSIIQFGAQHESELIGLVSTSRYVTVVGEDFGWLSDPIILYDALRDRLGKGMPSRIITPHPDFKPEPNRDRRLESIVHHVGRDHWDKVKTSVAGNMLIRLIGVHLLLPYTAIMTDAELWIRHTLAATSRYKTIWTYEPSEDVENFYFQIEADLKRLEEDAMRHVGWDLVERYRPEDARASPSGSA